ncbi:unnamed protein product [Peniophora sp. CBMAI 1063]|nr:unnamed protein product [Peniophora sp. CBMAI 1063]
MARNEKKRANESSVDNADVRAKKKTLKDTSEPARMGRPRNVGDSQYDLIISGLPDYLAEKQKKKEGKKSDVTKVFNDKTFEFIAHFGWKNPLREAPKVVSPPSAEAIEAVKKEAQESARIVGDAAATSEDLLQEHKRRDQIVTDEITKIYQRAVRQGDSAPKTSLDIPKLIKSVMSKPSLRQLYMVWAKMQPRPELELEVDRRHAAAIEVKGEDAPSRGAMWNVVAAEWYSACSEEEKTATRQEAQKFLEEEHKKWEDQSASTPSTPEEALEFMEGSQDFLKAMMKFFANRVSGIAVMFLAGPTDGSISEAVCDIPGQPNLLYSQIAEEETTLWLMGNRIKEQARKMNESKWDLRGEDERATSDADGVAPFSESCIDPALREATQTSPLNEETNAAAACASPATMPTQSAAISPAQDAAEREVTTRSDDAEATSQQQDQESSARAIAVAAASAKLQEAQAKALAARAMADAANAEVEAVKAAALALEGTVGRPRSTDELARVELARTIDASPAPVENRLRTPTAGEAEVEVASGKASALDVATAVDEPSLTNEPERMEVDRPVEASDSEHAGAPSDTIPSIAFDVCALLKDLDSAESRYISAYNETLLALMTKKPWWSETNNEAFFKALPSKLRRGGVDVAIGCELGIAYFGFERSAAEERTLGLFADKLMDVEVPEYLAKFGEKGRVWNARWHQRAKPSEARKRTALDWDVHVTFPRLWASLQPPARLNERGSIAMPAHASMVWSPDVAAGKEGVRALVATVLNWGSNAGAEPSEVGQWRYVAADMAQVLHVLAGQAGQPQMTEESVKRVKCGNGGDNGGWGNGNNNGGWGNGNNNGGWGNGNNNGAWGDGNNDGWGNGNNNGGWGNNINGAWGNGNDNAGWNGGQNDAQAAGQAAGGEVAPETEDGADVELPPVSTSKLTQLLLAIALAELLSALVNPEAAGLLHLDMIIYILISFLPPLDELPLTILGTLLSTQCLITITSAMAASRVWYSAAMMTCALWGGLMVLARSERQWIALNALARDAPRRLLYTDRLPNALQDSVLHLARAVYAPALSTWRHWGVALQGRAMPYVETLLLGPNEDSKPPGRLPSPDQPVFAPRLRKLRISSPSVVLAWRLQSFVALNFAPDQIVVAIREMPYLVHLEIRRVISDDAVDWTALLSEGTWSMLEHLTIVCDAHQHQALAYRSTPVSTPRLRGMYVTCAVLVDAPWLKNLHAVRVRYVDYARILQRAHSVVSTTLRGSTSVRLPNVYSNAWPTTTVLLDALESVRIYGDVCDHKGDLFSAISIPNAREIRLLCDMSAPPNHQAVVEIGALLRMVLRLNSDVPELMRALQHARRGFRLSGHPDLSSSVERLMREFLQLPPAERRVGVQDLADEVTRRMDDPIASQADVALRAAVEAVAQALDVDVAQAQEHSDARLVIEGMTDGIHYTTTLSNRRGYSQTFLVCMTQPRTVVGLSGSATWERRDSLTLAASRMLESLRPFAVRNIHLKKGCVDAFATSTRTYEDVNALASTLARYTALHTLHFTFGLATVGRALVQALDWHNLPALSTIRVEAPEVDSATPSHTEWFEELEAALARRTAKDRRLQLLEIRGGLCLCQLWLERIRSLVDVLDAQAACTNGIRDVCIFCRPAAVAEFWP